MSNEILIPDEQIELAGIATAFSLDVSVPPRSHRSPQPLWQDLFDEIGGALLHVGDVDTINRNRRFCMYDSVTWKGSRQFRFQHALRAEYAKLLQQVFDAAPDRHIFVTYDVWLGPPKRTRDVIRRSKFLDRITEGATIRSNACYELTD